MAQFIYHFHGDIKPMNPKLSGMLSRLGPFNTISICFFSVYILMAILSRDTLVWKELDLHMPALALLVALILAWSLFLLRKKKGVRKIDELEGERKRLARNLLEAVPLVLIYQNVSFFGRTMRYDQAMYRADEWLTGIVPAIWAQNVYSNLFTEIMSFSYFIYLFAPITYMLIYWKRSYVLFRKYLFATVFMHFIALMFYVAVPVEGPKYYYANEFTSGMGGWVLTDFNRWFIESIRSTTTDCFPSMHVGLFLLMTYYMYRHDRRSLWVTIPVTLLMSMSTLYLRYHYFIDVVAGIVLVCIAIVFTHLLFRIWKRDIGEVT